MKGRLGGAQIRILDSGREQLIDREYDAAEARRAPIVRDRIVEIFRGGQRRFGAMDGRGDGRGAGSPARRAAIASGCAHSAAACASSSAPRSSGAPAICRAAASSGRFERREVHARPRAAATRDSG